MITKTGLASILLLSVLATSSSAEALYTLASPEEEEWGVFGYSVSGAGDVNGDGYDDVAVGAYCEDPGASPDDAGRTYVFDGQIGTLVYTLISPNEEGSGVFGYSVSGTGDVNADGYDDVVVGAYKEDPGASPDDAGRAYVFDGQTGALLHTLVSPNEEVNGLFGISVSGAGDVNGDGYYDVIVGARGEDPGSSPTNSGRAYVFDGQTGIPLHTLLSPNEQEGSHFGISVSGAGDMNGDGNADVMVGARGEGPGASSDDAGRAYVFDGQTGALLHTLVSPNEEEDGNFGYSVSGAGDVNGDGYDDVAVGAGWEDPEGSPQDAGRAYVFDGQMGTLLHTLISPNEQGTGYFGVSVSGAGDINADGYDEVVVGACFEVPGVGLDDAGRAYVFDGQTGALLHTLDSPNQEYEGCFGYPVSGAGDVNGDGYDDVAVGAGWEDPGISPMNAGRAYVFSWMNLSSSLSGDTLGLQWSPWPTATEYWVYGADNYVYFIPALSPGYENRLIVLPSGTTAWSSPNGIGDPDHNWTYLVIAVDGSESELARSNYCGEWDFGIEIP